MKFNVIKIVKDNNLKSFPNACAGNPVSLQYPGVLVQGRWIPDTSVRG